MNTRIPVQTIVVKRDGQTVVPKIGKPFDFTDDELADIEKLNPSAVRTLVNETVEPAAPAAPKTGGKKKGDAEL